MSKKQSEVRRLRSDPVTVNYEYLPPVGSPDQIEADLFLLKQGTPVSMAYDAMYINANGDPDLERPFDPTPVKRERGELPADKDVVHVDLLQEFNRYCDESYMTEEVFMNREVKYGDERDNSILIVNGGSEARVYIYGKKMVIAFRGTDTSQGFISGEFVTDLMTDLSTKIQSLGYIGIGEDYHPDYRGMVHQGFADYVLQIYEPLKQLVLHHYGGDVEELYVCGHSLGGIASQIFSYKLFVEESIKANRIITYGSPSGIFTFGNVLEQELSIINVMHTHDIVCLVAPMFRHHGYKVVIDLDYSVHVYKPFEPIPYLYYEPDTALEYALRKNGAFRSRLADETGDITSRVQALQDDENLGATVDKDYDNYVNSGTIYRTVDNIRSFLSSMLYKPQQQVLSRVGTIAMEADKFYHTAYSDTLERIPPGTVNLKPETVARHPNPRLHTTHSKDRYKYKATVGGHTLYTDNRDDKLVKVSNSVQGVDIAHINRTEPLGLYFYKKGDDIEGKAIVFYS